MACTARLATVPASSSLCLNPNDSTLRRPTLVAAASSSSPSCSLSSTNPPRSPARSPIFRPYQGLRVCQRLPSAASATAAAARAPLLLSGRRSKRSLRVVAADGDKTRELISSAIKIGNQGLDAAVKLLPLTVPRPVAKGGVALVALAITFSLVQAIFNSFVTLLFLGGLSYAAFVYLSGGGGGGGGGGSGSSGSKKFDDDDPLDEARRIMDKYK